MSPPAPDAVHVEFVVDDALVTDWDEPRIAALVRGILADEPLTPPPAACVVTLHLVTDACIRALNAQHRQLDVHTDVLSFPLSSADAFVVPPGEPVHLGDVVVSYPRAVAQATE